MHNLPWLNEVTPWWIKDHIFQIIPSFDKNKSVVSMLCGQDFIVCVDHTVLTTLPHCHTATLLTTLVSFGIKPRRVLLPRDWFWSPEHFFSDSRLTWIAKTWQPSLFPEPHSGTLPIWSSFPDIETHSATSLGIFHLNYHFTTSNLVELLHFLEVVQTNNKKFKSQEGPKFGSLCLLLVDEVM